MFCPNLFLVSKQLQYVFNFTNYNMFLDLFCNWTYSVLLRTSMYHQLQYHLLSASMSIGMLHKYRWCWEFVSAMKSVVCYAQDLVYGKRQQNIFICLCRDMYIQRERASRFFLFLQLKSQQSNSKIIVNLKLVQKKKK